MRMIIQKIKENKFMTLLIIVFLIMSVYNVYANDKIQKVKAELINSQKEVEEAYEPSEIETITNLYKSNLLRINKLRDDSDDESKDSKVWRRYLM